MVSELRPRGIGEILDSAVALYRARFGKLMLVAAAVVIPVQVLSAMVLLSAQPESYHRLNFSGSVTPQYDANSALLGLAAVLVITVVSLLSTAFVVAVCTRIVADAYIDRDSAARDAVRAVRPRLFAVIGLTILVSICDAIGLAFCIVGVLVPLTLFAVAIPVLILEGITVSAAISRSVNLTKSNAGHVLGVVLVAGLLVRVLSLGFAVAVNYLLRSGDSVVSAVIGQSIASAIAAILTTPFVATATVALYFDLRIRNEAFDVQLLMQRNEPRVAV
jgi:hypothetical protein